MTSRDATTVEGPAVALSEGQIGLWIQDQLGAGGAYNVSFAYRLGRTLDVDAMREAVLAAVARHQAFRTVFRESDGTVVGQVLADPPPVEVNLEWATQADADQRLRASWTTPFELSAERLVRVLLLDVESDHYVLSFTVHHIVFDDWSMGLWLDELEALYAAQRGGGSRMTTEPDDTRMGAYQRWANERRASPDRGRRLEAAVELLSEVPQRLDLPRRKVEPGSASWQGSAVEAVLDVGVADRVRAVARASGCTEYVLYHAAWATLVSIYSQHPVIAVGTPIADRLGVNADALVGYFLNTVVVRHDIRDENTFADVLVSAREAFFQGVENADASYEEVVRSLASSREDPTAPLFSTWFALDDATSDLTLDGVTVERLEVPVSTAKFELALFVSLGRPRHRLVLEYMSALYDRSTMESMLRHYIALLDVVTTDPAIRVRDIDILDTAEREVLERWGARGATPGESKNIAAEFARTARTFPQHMAVEHGDVQLTYSALHRMVDAVSAHLRAVGVGPGDVVGVAVGRSPAMVAAVLGALTAGAAYVALDPGYPRARLNHMVADCGVRVVLADRSTADRIGELGIPVMIPVDAATVPLGEPTPSDQLSPTALAYVTYTSGSTGTPKGIRMSHAAVWNLLGWQQQHYASVGRGHRTLQFAALSFDVSAQEIFGALCNGGVLVLIDQAERDAIHGIMALVRDRRVDRVFMAAPALLEAVESAVALGVVPDRLRVVVSGSEQLVVSDALRTFFQALPPDARLHNEYGPSETHVATMFEAPADPTLWPTWMPIGRPVGETEVRLLDAHLRLAPPGSVGEICLSGPGLADGYSGLPRATAQAFVPDPYSAHAGARMYRTGDIARFLPDGSIEFLGRRDTQVKIRGYRIELEEIRAVLDAVGPVAQSFVMLSDQAGQSAIAAFWVRRAGEQSADDVDVVWKHLREHLPSYMLPAHLIEVPAFPLTPHGKVDQRALVATHLDPVGLVAHVHTPDPSGDPLALAIVAVMARILDRADLGEHDDFFAFGGNSLLANRLVWTLEVEQTAAVGLRAIFDGRTAVGIAALALPPRPRGVPSRAQAASVSETLSSLIDQIGKGAPDGRTTQPSL